MKTVSALLFAGVLAAQAQPPALKTLHDAADGVSFQYPAPWITGPGVNFYLGSEILDSHPEIAAKGPRAKVGFVAARHGPYAGTNLNGVQFVFNVIPGSTAADCRKRVQDLSETPIADAVIHGIRYNHFSGGDAGLGHQASRQIYSTMRAGNCYLFEESIHTSSAGDPRSVSNAQWKHLRRELDAVMQSVRFDAAQ